MSKEGNSLFKWNFPGKKTFFGEHREKLTLIREVEGFEGKMFRRNFSNVPFTYFITFLDFVQLFINVAGIK